MASVTQCDICNNVIRHEESKYIEVSYVDKYDNLDGKICSKEVCPECYKKIKKILKIDLKEEN